MATGIPGVRMHPFDVIFANSASGIRYSIPDEVALTGLDIWEPLSERTTPTVSTLEVQSGGGKTTLANCLAAFLSGETSSPGRFNWTRDPDDAYAASMLPQRYSTILHWRVRDIIPPDSPLLSMLFSASEAGDLQKKYLSELSGGQTTRILLASAIEKVVRSRTTTYYLVMDEPFDGVDPELGNEVLQSCLTYVGSNKDAPFLRVLLISHFDPSVGLKGIHCRRLKLSVLDTVSLPKDEVALKRVLVHEAP